MPAKWGFWEWLAFGPIGASALIQAVEEAAKKAPAIRAAMPDWGAWWAFLPLGLLIFSGLIFALRALGLVGKKNQPERAWGAPAKQVFRQTYAHQTVLLDGHSFFECVFDSATLTFDGTAPYSLINCKFLGRGEDGEITLQLRSHNQVVGAAWTLINELGLLKKKMDFTIIRKAERGDSDSSS